MKGWLKRLCPGVMLLMLLGLMQLTALAHEVPEQGRTGTITVEMSYQNTAVTGGTLAIYRVGDVAAEDGNYGFVKTTAFASFSGSIDNFEDAGLAGRLRDFVTAGNLSPEQTASNSGGTVQFSGVAQGLYLVMQPAASNGFEAINPFLISLPAVENGHYVYDVTAAGKFELVQASPSPSAKPTGRLPQTGQMNWPIPLLAILGMVLLLSGWQLRRRARANR